MVTIGTPFKKNATKVLLFGSGEIGKELAIEFQKYGIEIIAVDNYENAPAMQVSQKKYVINMMNKEDMLEIIYSEKPTYIVPEIEAINIDALIECEKYGYNVVPSSKAISYCMNREKIRNLASLKLKLNTSKYIIVKSKKEFINAINKMNYPCISKPTMSSSGKGQSLINCENDIEKAWINAKKNARGNSNKIIVEEFINFDYEITLLTLKSKNKISFCRPIGHKQIDGDYRQSWQPQKMNKEILKQAKKSSELIINELNGDGIYGVEFFIKNDELYFNEIAPRPHDTGFVTLLSQNYSEFELHARAILGIPIKKIIQKGMTASLAIVKNKKSKSNGDISYNNIEKALNENCDIRIFGKPDVQKKRRLGVIIARSSTIKKALEICERAEKEINIKFT